MQYSVNRKPILKGQIHAENKEFVVEGLLARRRIDIIDVRRNLNFILSKVVSKKSGANEQLSGYM